MKKTIIAVIFLAIAVGIFEFIDSGRIKIQDFKNFSAGQIADIQKQVFTSGTLRSKTDAPGAYLTVEGIIKYTNQQREQNNLPPLKVNVLLTQAAALKVNDMFDRQYFEHISPTGAGPADLARQVNYDYIAVGENLALGNYKSDEDLVKAWMDSPGHRANILNKNYREIGVYVLKKAYEGKQTYLAVQEFGRPGSDCPQINSMLKTQIDAKIAELDQLEAQIKLRKSQLESGKPKTKEEVDAYNQNVREYNDFIKIYNNKIDQIKSLQSQYNFQIQSYNQCLAQ